MKKSILILNGLLITLISITFQGCLSVDEDDNTLVINGFEIATAFQLDAQSTFLRTNNDNAIDPLFYDLTLADVSPGDSLRLERVGAFESSDSTTSNILIAVFSSTNEIYSSDSLNRIPGAIDVPVDFETNVTLSGLLPTDIEEDFQIEDRTGITVPDGGRYLFLAPYDQFYEDNQDQNFDFGIILYKRPAQ